MYFARLPPAELLQRLPEAGGVTLAFGAGAWLLRGVTLWGAVAGMLAAVVLYMGAGRGAFLTLLAVFVVTWLATRLGRGRKQRLGTAEPGRGRSAVQVASNLYAAAALMLLPAGEHAGGWPGVIAAMAVLAELAADTVSSEVGQAVSPRAYLVTTFRQVPVGTDGGVSLPGTLAGVLSAFGIAAMAAFTDAMWWHALPLVALAALAGMVLDSLLGATLERGGRLGNNAVNALSTGAAAAIALAVMLA